MAVTDLTNTKWLFDDNITLPSTEATPVEDGYIDLFSVSFISNSSNYVGFSLYSSNGRVWNSLSYKASIYRDVYLGGWYDQAYRTIEITGGTDVTNASLISWLTANATQITTGGSMYLGTSNISKMYIGQNEVEKVYLGQDLVYEKQAPTPSGYSVSGKNYVIYTNCCYYSTDGGTTWIDASTIPTGQLKDFTITGITQLMVKCFENSNDEYGYMVWGSVGISGRDKSSSNPAIYDFGTLTADITGMELSVTLD